LSKNPISAMAILPRREECTIWTAVAPDAGLHSPHVRHQATPRTRIGAQICFREDEYPQASVTRCGSGTSFGPSQVGGVGGEWDTAALVRTGRIYRIIPKEAAE
jgi:hypothetical protein